jgi:hypothetical protein
MSDKCLFVSSGPTLINFGRQPKWNCPIPVDESNAEKRPQGSTTVAPVTDGVQPWFIPPIPCYEPEDGVFYAHIGPTGGKAGYQSITGNNYFFNL